MADDPVMTREQFDRLADQIAELSLRIDKAKHALLTHLREFAAHDGWYGSGFVSAASWLAWRIDIGPKAAREHVRVARALGELRRIDAAFASGKLSYSKVRAITRVARLETEQDFIDIAMNATASQVETLVRGYRRTRVDPSEPTGDLRRFVRRTETQSGMVRIEVQLPPEQAKLVWEALSAALDAGRHDEAPAEASGAAKASAEASVEPKREQVDPIVLQAERADALVSVDHLSHALASHARDQLRARGHDDQRAARLRHSTWSCCVRAIIRSRDGNPKWDGSRFDLDEVLSWMWGAEKTRAASLGSRKRET